MGLLCRQPFWEQVQQRFYIVLGTVTMTSTWPNFSSIGPFPSIEPQGHSIFARSPSVFAEVFSPQRLVLFPASRSAFEVSPQAHKRSKEISPRISRSVRSSRSFQAEKKRSLPVKASGVPPPTKNEVEVHHICQEKLASGVKFPKPKSRSQFKVHESMAVK